MLLPLLEISFTCFSSADGMLSEISYILMEFQDTTQRKHISQKTCLSKIFNSSIHDDDNRLQQIY